LEGGSADVARQNSDAAAVGGTNKAATLFYQGRGGKDEIVPDPAPGDRHDDGHDYISGDYDFSVLEDSVGVEGGDRYIGGHASTSGHDPSGGATSSSLVQEKQADQQRENGPRGTSLSNSNQSLLFVQAKAAQRPQQEPNEKTVAGAGDDEVDSLQTTSKFLQSSRGTDAASGKTVPPPTFSVEYIPTSIYEQMNDALERISPTFKVSLANAERQMKQDVMKNLYG
ncbi:unnamed protein product, partial [Amoebophrya sp. A120]